MNGAIPLRFRTGMTARLAAVLGLTISIRPEGDEAAL
jgi:hypothetical protein